MLLRYIFFFLGGGGGGIFGRAYLFIYLFLEGVLSEFYGKALIDVMAYSCLCNLIKEKIKKQLRNQPQRPIYVAKRFPLVEASCLSVYL